jgi:DDE superfamily endonuclease
VAELLRARVNRHPTGTIDVSWDHADTHFDEDVEAVVRAAAGRLVRFYLPIDSPWLYIIEMRWRQFRREVTHGELFVSLDTLLKAGHGFFDHHIQPPDRVLSIIGTQTHNFCGCT